MILKRVALHVSSSININHLYMLPFPNLSFHTLVLTQGFMLTTAKRYGKVSSCSDAYVISFDLFLVLPLVS